MACTGCNSGCNKNRSSLSAAYGFRSSVVNTNANITGIVSNWGVGRHNSVCPGGCLQLVGGVWRCSSICAGCIGAQQPYCPYNPT